MERARLVEPVILLLGPKWIDRHPVETAHPNRLLPPRTVMGIRVVLLGISDGSIHCGRVVGSVEPDPERFSDR
jgi:hypothetical protein